MEEFTSNIPLRSSWYVLPVLKWNIRGVRPRFNKVSACNQAPTMGLGFYGSIEKWGNNGAPDPPIDSLLPLNPALQPLYGMHYYKREHRVNNPKNIIRIRVKGIDAQVQLNRRSRLLW